MGVLGTVVLRGVTARRDATNSAGDVEASRSSDDSDLMALVAERSEEALGELYDRFALDCYRLALRILGQRELAEDAVQDAFLSIWRSAERFDSRRGSARSWILMLVHRRSVDLIRRTRRSRLHDTRVLSTSLAPSAAEVTQLGGERRAVQTALASLPGKQRIVLELAYYGGYTQQEIAARLAIPIGTVKSQTYDALRRLRDLLDPETRLDASVRRPDEIPA